MEEVFETLRCNKEGLSTEAAEQRLTIFGYNKLEEKQVLLLGQFVISILRVYFYGKGMKKKIKCKEFIFYEFLKIETLELNLSFIFEIQLKKNEVKLNVG